MRCKYSLIAISVLVGLLAGRKALAVPPPDFIFNIGSSIAQVFSLMFLFLSVAFSAVYQYMKAGLATKKSKLMVGLIMVYLTVFVSILGAYLYSAHSERRAYLNWLEMSREQTKQALEQSGVTSTDDLLEPLNINNGWIGHNQDEEVVGGVETGTSSGSDIIKVNVTDSSPTTTNLAFSEVLASGFNDFLVLDAREDIEYEIGHFLDSLHIRSADLRAGRWRLLPIDKTIYVICWSGIRGLEVAEFLRSKNIPAVALENGALGWVEDGGDWQGGILFSKAYPDEKYAKLYSTGEVQGLRQQGVILVDSREPYKYDQWHMPGTVNIPLIYTASIDLEEKFNQIPSGSKVITVCDAYVNCFDAKLTGIELEKRGHEFLGRYNSPWELK